MSSPSATAKRAILQEAKGLQALSGKLGHDFDNAVESFASRRIIFLSGVGKSGHICRKLAATMTSLGTKAVFIHPTEAAHGDMGLIGSDDALLLFSRSGKATEIYPLTDRAGILGLPTVLVSECDDDFLATRVDHVIKIPKIAEAWGHAPTTSTVMQMAIGDAIAIALAEIKGYKWENFKTIHPGGALGNVA
tara:strand:- start:1190 stop:1765 length:576 start_codon:yes stop_codon:yes gene_type:complete